MKALTIVLIAVMGVASAAAAQTTTPRFPAPGVVVGASPVFVPREDDRDLTIMLPAGTPVQVLGRRGPWFRVVFPTPEGDRTGVMQPHDVQINPQDVSLGDFRRTALASQRGTLEVRGSGFPETVANDSARMVTDALVRQEVFLKPARWIQFAGGLDMRHSSNDEVESDWRLDWNDRGLLRPKVAVRRFTLSLTSSHLSIDLGKQFIRWGRTDILSPVDRFAPRDYLNVLDNQFLPVTAARVGVRAGSETFELVWVPRLTPSRLPLPNKRWTVLPPELAGLQIDAKAPTFPDDAQQGFRWSHSGRFEMGLSFFDGFNHLPDLDIEVDPSQGRAILARSYSAVRSYGAEVSVPTEAITLKGEAAWFTSPAATDDEYVLYVIELERQMGEWLFDAGYTGEVVTTARRSGAFGAERGVADSFIGHASYTIDPRKSFEIEGAARRNGHGVYLKGEYSQTFGRYLRLTLGAAGLGGRSDDFLGQYSRNSHVSATLRVSY